MNVEILVVARLWKGWGGGGGRAGRAIGEGVGRRYGRE